MDNRPPQTGNNTPARIDQIRAGFLCRCPNCGKGRLFEGFLKVVDACAVCGFDFTRLNTGDGAAISSKGGRQAGSARRQAAVMAARSGGCGCSSSARAAKGGGRLGSTVVSASRRKGQGARSLGGPAPDPHRQLAMMTVASSTE